MVTCDDIDRANTPVVSGYGQRIVLDNDDEMGQNNREREM